MSTLRFLRAWSPWHLRRAMERTAARMGGMNRCERTADGWSGTCRSSGHRDYWDDTICDGWCDSCVLTNAIDGNPAPLPLKE